MDKQNKSAEEDIIDQIQNDLYETGHGMMGIHSANVKILLSKLTTLQQANAELQARVALGDIAASNCERLEKQNAELADALDNLTRVVGKHHKNIAIPEQEDLYMAYHDALNVIKSHESNKQP